MPVVGMTRYGAGRLSDGYGRKELELKPGPAGMGFDRRNRGHRLRPRAAWPR